MADSTFVAHINPKGKEQSVQTHCLETAELAKSSLEPIGLGKTAYLAGLLHDCGKMHPNFSDYIRAAYAGESVRRGSVIHSFAGVSLVLGKLHTAGDLPRTLTAEVIAYAVGAHHGLFDLNDSDNVNGFTHRLQTQPEYDRLAIKNFFRDVVPEQTVKACFDEAVKEIGALFAKLQPMVQDGSQLHFYFGMHCRLVTSAVMDADRRDTAVFMGASVPRAPQADKAFWSGVLKQTETKLDAFAQTTPVQKARRELSDICRQFAAQDEGVYRLNIPTGGGKTLSGLRYALAHAAQFGKRRIVYTAPLISILEQNAEVIQSFTDPAMVLEHHSDVVEAQDGEDVLLDRSFLEETWDAPIVVTTLVQLLNTLFSGKSASVRRLRSLCDSVIILDEVQSVPTKMLNLFNLAVNFLSAVCRCTVLLCSATQPALETLPCALRLTGSMISDAQYRHYYDVFKRNTILDAGSRQLEEIPAFLEEVIREHESVLVVCNKKDEATFLYQAAAQFAETCYHLSAGMCMAHRKDVLRRVYSSLAEGRKTVCVATQVIEAGVDISFGAVVRLSAGMDSIVQAAGRCNRNGETDGAPPVYIVRCSDENLKQLPDIAKGKTATEALLYAYAQDAEQFDGDLSSPKAVAHYYKCLYRTFADNHFDFPVKDSPSLLSMMSDNITYYTDKTGGGYILRTALKTAGRLFSVFDEDTTAVLVPYGDGAQEIDKLMELYAQKDYDALRRQIRLVKAYSVTVYPFAMKKLLEENAVHAVCDGTFWILDPDFYSEETGIIYTKEENSCSILIL